MHVAAPLRRKPALSLAVAVSALLSVIALTIVLAAAGAFGGDTSTTVIEQSAAAARMPAFDAPEIFARANPGVVDITAHTTTTAATGPFGLPKKTPATDTGTGLVLDAHGHILTADHVVAGAHSITVTLQGGATRPAKVMGRDSGTDVAVLSVDPSGLTLRPLALGTLSGHRVGDPVAVIGDPFDVQRSLSTGVISGLDRSIQAPNGFSIPHALQTDAAINPGNSGGPVLDARGRVIGVADQIATGNSGADSSTGVGFAVSVDSFKGELAQLEAGTTPVHAYLGVSAGDASDSRGGTGALVQSVQAGGPAARAGVRPGDLIVALGGARIAGVTDVVADTTQYKPGDRIPVTVIRGGRRITLQLTPAKQPTRAVSG